MVAPSIELAGPGWVEGWPLHLIDDATLAQILGVGSAEARTRRPALEQEQRDPVRIDAVLARLPAPTLALLAILAAGGGVLFDGQLEGAARVRLGLSPVEVTAALRPAMKALLAVGLDRRGGGGTGYALLEPAASLVAQRVVDLDLAELSGPFAAREEPGARWLFSVCAMLAHADVKLTLDGWPNRGQIKRLAGAIGLPADPLEQTVVTAVALGLAVEVDGVLRPDRAVLEDAAAGRVPPTPALRAIAARVEHGPLSLEAARRLWHRSLDIGGNGGRRVHLAVDAMGVVPGLVAGKVAGVAALARAPAPTVAAAGHITPSFEVFLPPETAPIDLVRVGLCAELTRVDRVVSLRVTKASIGRALAAGASADDVLGWLAAASKSAIPQNVETTVRDWGAHVRHATVATGHVVVVEPATAGQARAALASLRPRELAPGVFVVDGGVRPAELGRLLVKAGVHVRGAVAPPAGAAERADRVAAAADAPATTRLRARVTAWRRGEPFEGVRDADLVSAAVPAAGPAAAPAPARPAVPEFSLPVALAAWVGRLRAKPPADLMHILEGALREVGPTHAAALLGRCADWQDLLQQAVAGLGASPAERSRVLRRLAGLADRPPGGSSSSSAETTVWQRTRIRERAEELRDRGEPCQLWLRNDRVVRLEILEVIRKGKSWMVLGADLDSDDDVALRLEEIAAIADLPPLPPRWIPAAGERPPAGHVPCPCGSGERYRKCCREPAP